MIFYLQKANQIVLSMLEFFDDNKIELDDLQAIGCDGTSVNTGVNKGVIRQLEEFLEKPLHHIVCLLHTNELPFRHIFAKVDGETSGPSSFKGSIGSALEECQNFSPVQFELIANSNFPILDKHVVSDLSRDQVYLYNICLVVIGNQNGKLSQIETNQIGPLNHSRWLTKASRTLRLYIATPKDSSDHWKKLHTLATFIVTCYAPSWFSIKCKPNIADAAKHFFNIVKLSRYLETNLRREVDKVLKTNFFAGHSESVLVAMLADRSKNSQAVDLIARIREQRTQEKATDGPRKYKSPSFYFENINVNSSDNQYDQLINWQDLNNIFESPITMNLNLEELRNFEAPKFPFHTQATERIIRLVSEASTRVIGKESRQGYVVNSMYSRAITGTFDTKRDYSLANINSLIEAKKAFKKRKH